MTSRQTTRLHSLVLSTAVIASTVLAGRALYISGSAHFTGDVTSTGSVIATSDIKTTEGDLYMTNDQGCVYVGGEAVDCHYVIAMTSTGGDVKYHPFSLHNTGSALGFTGSASILDFNITATAPGESLTFNCGFSTGSLLVHPGGGSGTGSAFGTATQLINAGVVATGGQLFVDGYSKGTNDSSTGGLLWRNNTWLKCTETATVENAAGAEARMVIHYRQF